MKRRTAKLALVVLVLPLWTAWTLFRAGRVICGWKGGDGDRSFAELFCSDDNHGGAAAADAPVAVDEAFRRMGRPEEADDAVVDGGNEARPTARTVRADDEAYRIQDPKAEEDGDDDETNLTRSARAEEAHRTRAPEADEQKEVEPTTKLGRLVNELSSSTYKYYVYDDTNLTRPDVRRMVKTRHRGTWPFNWGKRYKSYTLWEVMWIEALENHPRYRTRNASEADFILIPIPVGGILYMKSKVDAQRALDALFKKELFRTAPEKHVLISAIEFLFARGEGKNSEGYSGWTLENYAKLKDITVVKDRDVHVLHRLGINDVPYTKHGWSMSFSGEASHPDVILDVPTVDKFRNNRSLHYFYHTPDRPSWGGSTPYRHAPVKAKSSLTQPSSVGYDIPRTEWLRKLSSAKFCLSIRGDNPQSRSLWRSIRIGCIPVVISDLWPYYSPVFRSFVNMEDYAVVVSEEEFMNDPAGALNRATNLSGEELRRKVEDLGRFQRMIMTDHPRSLFVPAFCRETLASWTREYYDFPNDVLKNVSEIWTKRWEKSR